MSMPKSTNASGRPIAITQLGKRAIAMRMDGALEEQLAKLEILFGCNRGRVVEILASDAIVRYYEPVLDEAMAILKLAADGSAINAAEVRSRLVSEFGINAEAAAEIEARAARKLRYKMVKAAE